MIAAIILASAAVAPASDELVYSCQYYETDAQMSDGWVHVVALRAVRHNDATWLIERPNDPPVQARESKENFGKTLRTVALKWQDEREANKTAYVSFADVVLPDNVKVAWLTFDRPSFGKAPAYFCQTKGGAK